jgi:hypothetical protein
MKKKRTSEVTRYIKTTKARELLRMNVDASRAVFEDALDTYRKRELDMTVAWGRVERAQTRLRLDREYLAKHGGK